MLEFKRIAVAPEVIDQVYSSREIVLADCQDLDVNEYTLLISTYDPKRSAIVRHLGNGQCQSLVSKRTPVIEGISPKDARQSAFVDSLLRDETLLSVCIGSAGTGKTTLSLAFAAHKYLTEGKKICLTKPTYRIGRSDAFGPVPGDIQEKFEPYLASYKIVLEKIFSTASRDFFDTMIKNKHLQYIPIETVRGCTFDDCTFIVDEAQNLGWDELNSIISRMGQNTDIIVLGDLNQIDVDLDLEDTGLYKMINSKSFRSSSISTAIELKTQYRSEITKLMNDVNTELREARKKKPDLLESWDMT